MRALSVQNELQLGLRLRRQSGRLNAPFALPGKVSSPAVKIGVLASQPIKQRDYWDCRTSGLCEQIVQ